MIKKLASLTKYAHTKRPFSSFPLPIAPPHRKTHKDFCFSLAEQLIDKGLLPQAKKVIQRLILECSSVQEIMSAVDFAIARGMELDLVNYASLIRKLVISGDCLMAKSVYSYCVVGRGLVPNRELLNSMVICYSKLGELDLAKPCFDRMIDLDCAPWVGSCNAIVKGFCLEDRFLDGYECVRKVSGLVLDYACYNRLVNGLCHGGFVDEGLSVFYMMVDRGVPPTVHLYKSVVIAFCKCRRVEEAEFLCTEFEYNGFVGDNCMYSCLINAYCKERKMKMAMRLFMRMRKLGYEPDVYTYNTLIHGFVNLGLFDKGFILHHNMVESGLKPDLVTYQIMINGFCKGQNVYFALKLLDDMLDCNMAPNVHCYTPLISALFKERMWEEVDSVYHKMVENDVVPDHVLFFTLVKNLPEGDELYLARMVLQTIACKSRHIDASHMHCSTKPKSIEDMMLEIEYLLDQIVLSDSLFSETAFSIYIIALCAGRKLDAAIKLTEKMTTLGFLPLITAFNSLIRLFFQEGQVEGAESLLEVIQDHGLVPDETTFSIIANELCKRGDPFSAIQVLDSVEKRRVKPNVAMYNSIINCLSSQKMVYKAENVFYRMLEVGVHPDERVFIAMINAYSKNGWANKAQELFETMKKSGIRPNSHAYTALIPGFVKKNKINKACTYLDRMVNEGFMPNVVLYTSLVNQFLKKRRLLYAMRFISLMEKSGMEKDTVMYITLLSGVSRNIAPFYTKWCYSVEKTDSSWERLYNLLHRTTVLAIGENMKPLVSSPEEMQRYALQLVYEIKKTPFMPNLHLCNGMIAGFCWARRMNEAYEYLVLMKSERLLPNTVTFTILINGHLRLGEVDHAIHLFNKMNALGFSPDGILFNNLVAGVSKLGRAADALSLSLAMRKRGLVPSKETYSKLLRSLCVSLLSVEALRTFEDMISLNYFPCRYDICRLLFLFGKVKNLDEALLLKKSKFQRSVDDLLMLGRG